VAESKITDDILCFVLEEIPDDRRGRGANILDIDLLHIQTDTIKVYGFYYHSLLHTVNKQQQQIDVEQISG